MKNFGLFAGMLLMSLSINAAPASSFVSGSQAEFRITDGKLYREGELVLGSFSVVRSQPGYIFFYIPDFGLVTVAPTSFPGGEQNGSFQGRQLSFNVDGTDFVLKASDPIIGENGNPAWVSVDAEYSLKNKSAMIGYGDDPQTPYGWPMYEGK